MTSCISGINYFNYKSNTKSTIKIDLRNLIITGGNGSGKTSLLTKLYSAIEHHCGVHRYHHNRENKSDAIIFLEKSLKKSTNTPSEQDTIKNKIELLKSFNDRNWEDVEIELNDDNSLMQDFLNKKAIIRFYKANRFTSIQNSSGARNVDFSDINSNTDITVLEQLASLFEQHLVNLKTQQSFATTYNNDNLLHQKIENWFCTLEKSLSFLMEDNSFKLIFEPSTFKFFLTQDGKIPYTFQTLSSGYSSMLSIVSDLIMTTEAYDILPTDLCGVILIDEVDAHLHVSLQRKILPFLTNLYPKIQFIVTTHSPFVIGSLEDAVIYDISSEQHFCDLSSYSFEVIMEGLLNTPIISISLERNITKLLDLINAKDADIKSIYKIVTKLESQKEKLDNDSAIVLLKAKSILRERVGSK